MSLFFFDFGSPWALHGMGSYAIRTRRRSPNTLFCFLSIFWEKLPKECKLGPFRLPFLLKHRYFCEKRGFKKCFKKRCPPRRKQRTISKPRGSLTAPLACKGFLNKKQQSEQETTKAADHCRSCGSISISGCFLSNFLAEVVVRSWFSYVFWMKLLKTLKLSRTQGPWSDTPWAKARRINNNNNNNNTNHIIIILTIIIIIMIIIIRTI